MKSIYLLLFALCLLSTPAHAEDESGPPSGLGYARVSFIEGDALFNSPDTDEWVALSPNFPLRDGDRVWAGEDSKVEVRFDGGGTAWANYESELDLTSVRRDSEGDTYQLALPSGEASFEVGNFSILGSVFQVDTPGPSVRAYGAARFRVSVLSDGTTQVGVKQGSVEVETESGLDSVDAGTLFEVDADGYTRSMALPGDDGWDSWVAARSERYDRTYKSARYLPDDMKGYADEFEESGRWERSPDYGNVWVPDVASDWSPYSNGRWVWVAGDYVWLPFDPWYAPFHFGRWQWAASSGWCWVPPHRGGAYWSPGYVGWSWGADRLYWVPLAPNEIYYGYGNYGPQSVNVRRHTSFNVTNVYINSTVRHGVVGMDRDDFLKGRHKRVELKDTVNPFRPGAGGRTRLIARPPVEELKPLEETRLPRPDVKPHEKALPPGSLAGPAPFITERSVARHRDESSFRSRENQRQLKGPSRRVAPEQSAAPQEKALLPQTTQVPQAGETRPVQPQRNRFERTRPAERRGLREVPGDAGGQVREQIPAKERVIEQPATPVTRPERGRVRQPAREQVQEQVIEQPTSPVTRPDSGRVRQPAREQVQEQTRPQPGLRSQETTPTLQQTTPDKGTHKAKNRLRPLTPEEKKAGEKDKEVVNPANK